MRNFEPSSCSYGCVLGCAHGLGDAADVPVEPEEEGTSTREYVQIGLDIYKTLFGEETDARTNAAEIQAKLTQAEQNRARGTAAPFTAMFSGLSARQYWDREIVKLRAQLDAANEIAGDIRTGAQIDQLRNMGYTVAVFAGVLVISGVAVTMVQKARLQQIEIEKAKAGGV